MKTIFSTSVFVLIALIVISALVYYGNQKNDKVTSGISEKIYVAIEGSGEIAVLHPKTNTLIKKIDLSENKNGRTVSYMPHNIEVAPDNRSVWVTANAMSEDMDMSFRVMPLAEADEGHGDEGMMAEKDYDEVVVIDPRTDAIVQRINVGSDLHLSHVSLSPDSLYAVAASQEKGVIYVINATSFQIEKEIMTKDGAGPHGLRISPDGAAAYIAMLGGKSLGILDMKSFVLRDVPLSGAAVQTGVTPNGKYALASIYDTKSLAIYDIASAKLSYIDLPKEAKGPVQIYPTPDSRYVYVADQGYYFNQPSSDLIYKIDLQEMKVAETIKGGTAPHGVVVSKDGKFVYVSNLLSDDVSVIDIAAGKEVARIPAGNMPNGISIWYGEGLDDGAENFSGAESGELSPDKKSLDFGTVSMAKGDVNHLFAIKNTGNAPVTISKIYTSCMCTEVVVIHGDARIGPFGMLGHGGLSSQINETVNPSQEISIEVSVDPTAHGPEGTGPAKKIVYIESDSAINPVLKLELDINVIP